jgi:folate-dependent phosphoribosylglycinamide formyltransferase PurN
MECMYIKVVDNKELETGITVHYVNENTMRGAIITQQVLHYQL